MGLQNSAPQREVIPICLRIDQLSFLNGLWYEQGRINSWFEPKNLTNATATYQILDSNDVNNEVNGSMNGTNGSNIKLDIVNRGMINGKQIQSHAVATPVHAVKCLLNNVNNTSITGGNSIAANFEPQFDNVPFKGSYIIMDARLDHISNANDYLVVGTKNKNLLWLLTRSTVMNQDLFTHAKMIAAENGYLKSTLDNFTMQVH